MSGHTNSASSLSTTDSSNSDFSAVESTSLSADGGGLNHPPILTVAEAQELSRRIEYRIYCGRYVPNISWAEEQIYQDAVSRVIRTDGHVAYVHQPPPNRNNAADQTSFIEGQATWNFDNVPPIMKRVYATQSFADVQVGCQLGNGTRSKFPNPLKNQSGDDMIELFANPGEEPKTMLSFEILPARIATNVEGFRLEAWLRYDPRILRSDILMRMSHPKLDENALNMVSSRFRNANRLYAFRRGNRENSAKTRNENVSNLTIDQTIHNHREWTVPTQRHSSKMKTLIDIKETPTPQIYHKGIRLWFLNHQDDVDGAADFIRNARGTPAWTFTQNSMLALVRDVKNAYKGAEASRLWLLEGNEKEEQGAVQEVDDKGKHNEEEDEDEKKIEYDGSDKAQGGESKKPRFNTNFCKPLTTHFLTTLDNPDFSREQIAAVAPPLVHTTAENANMPDWGMPSPNMGHSSGEGYQRPPRRGHFSAPLPAQVPTYAPVAAQTPDTSSGVGHRTQLQSQPGQDDQSTVQVSGLKPIALRSQGLPAANNSHGLKREPCFPLHGLPTSSGTYAQDSQSTPTTRECSLSYSRHPAQLPMVPSRARQLYGIPGSAGGPIDQSCPPVSSAGMDGDNNIRSQNIQQQRSHRNPTIHLSHARDLTTNAEFSRAFDHQNTQYTGLQHSTSTAPPSDITGGFVPRSTRVAPFLPYGNPGATSYTDPRLRAVQRPRASHMALTQCPTTRCPKRQYDTFKAETTEFEEPEPLPATKQVRRSEEHNLHEPQRVPARVSSSGAPWVIEPHPLINPRPYGFGGAHSNGFRYIPVEQPSWEHADGTGTLFSNYNPGFENGYPTIAERFENPFTRHRVEVPAPPGQRFMHGSTSCSNMLRADEIHVRRASSATRAPESPLSSATISASRTPHRETSAASQTSQFQNKLRRDPDISPSAELKQTMEQTLEHNAKRQKNAKSADTHHVAAAQRFAETRDRAHRSMPVSNRAAHMRNLALEREMAQAQVDAAGGPQKQPHRAQKRKRDYPRSRSVAARSGSAPSNSQEERGDEHGGICDEDNVSHDSRPESYLFEGVYPDITDEYEVAVMRAENTQRFGNAAAIRRQFSTERAILQAMNMPRSGF